MLHRDKRLGIVGFVFVWVVAALPSETMGALLGSALFPTNNPWNQNISAAPVATNSDAIISNIIAVVGSNGRFHPDFGQDTQSATALYGIPYNVVHGNSNSPAKVNVVIGAYKSESDVQPVQIPANAVIEGDQQNGPTVGLNNRGDSHLLIYDEDNNVGYEFYQASRPSENSDGQWHAASETVWDMKSNTFRTLGWTSADAAGLPILPGLVRPDEALPTPAGQGIIQHALRFTLPNAIILNSYIYPASHTANPGNTNAAIQPPMGARFRLKASVNISSMYPQSRIVAQALKDYGLIVADNGSAFFMSGASYSVDGSNQFALTWNDNDIQDTTHGLKSLYYSNFEVVDLTPRVSSVSPAQGVAGTQVIITGQNFSGAAGRLTALFGTNGVMATATDDAHITAIAPTNSGNVDVRVQCGLSNGDFAANYTRPIWGYGLSPDPPSVPFAYQSELDAFHAWLASYGLPSDGSADYLDSDGDGMNNWQEFVAGTNPTNANSIFKINGVNASSGTVVVIRWLSASNRLYDVARATNLSTNAAAFAALPGGTNLPATPPQNSWTDTVTQGVAPAYYRIRVHQ